MSTFTYFGEECLADEEDASSGRATGVALRLAVASVAATDRGRFRRVSRANRAKVEDWLVVFRDWTAAETERPTGLPTDSSDGQSDTEETSETEPVIAVTTSMPERPVRADLQLAVLRSTA